MHAVALDLATRTGVAHWSAGRHRPAFTTLRLPGDPEEVARPMEALRAHLADLHRLEPITHLFFEAPIVAALNMHTVYKLCALAGMAEWFASRIDATCRQVVQGSWRKHFIGRGNGKSAELKRLAIEACKLRGWEVTDDHQADALGTLDYGLSCFKIPVPWRDDHMFRRNAA